MINEKHFQEAIAKYIPFVSIERGTEAAAAVFELAKQMAKEHNSELIKALDEIANPIKHMRQRLKDGEQLNGGMAIALAKDASYLREIAEKALREYSGTPASSLAQEAEGKWISVKDRLPEIDSDVICLANDGREIPCKYKESMGVVTFVFYGDTYGEVNYFTHWKLPSTPSSNKINSPIN